MTNDQKVLKAQAMRRATNLLRKYRDNYLDAGMWVEAESAKAMLSVRIAQLDAYIVQEFPIVEVRNDRL